MLVEQNHTMPVEQTDVTHTHDLAHAKPLNEDQEVGHKS